MMAQRVSPRVINFVLRLIQLPRIFFYRLISSNSIAGAPRCFQPLQAVGEGGIEIHPNVSFGFFPSPTFLSSYAYVEARYKSASIVIHSGTCINNNFSVIAEYTSITIGRDCLIGANVEIVDSDFHGIEVNERNASRPERAKPVVIGDNVFIGSNVKIFKGVKVGRGTVLAGGSVVTKDIPEGVIAGGCPAVVLRRIGS